MMKNTYILLAFLLLVSCKDLSSLFIDDGTSIDAQGNTVASIFEIDTNGSGCTAQAVSSNLQAGTMTVVTAAHCVDNSSNPTVVIVSGPMRGATSSNVYVPQAYFSGEDIAFAYDVAVVVFENVNPVGFFAMRHTMDTLKVGEQFYMVGYSTANVQIGPNGPKAWGQNVVQALARGDITISSNQNGGNTVSPGDSGGGAFTGCKLMGVASRRSVGGRSVGNLHTNLMWTGDAQGIEGNFKYLENIRSRNPNAYICGMHGWDPAHCPLTHLYYPDLNPTSGEFVCTSLQETS